MGKTSVIMERQLCHIYHTHNIITVEFILNIPNVAIWGSFFHFPKEAGGLSQVTLVWSSRSPMDRSATWWKGTISAFSPLELFIWQNRGNPLLSNLPLSFHHSARWWADQTLLQTPRGSSASRWCGWQLYSWLSWRLQMSRKRGQGWIVVTVCIYPRLKWFNLVRQPCDRDLPSRW